MYRFEYDGGLVKRIVGADGREWRFAWQVEPPTQENIPSRRAGSARLLGANVYIFLFSHSTRLFDSFSTISIPDPNLSVLGFLLPARRIRRSDGSTSREGPGVHCAIVIQVEIFNNIDYLFILNASNRLLRCFQPHRPKCGRRDPAELRFQRFGHP